MGQGVLSCIIPRSTHAGKGISCPLPKGPDVIRSSSSPFASSPGAESEEVKYVRLLQLEQEEKRGISRYRNDPLIPSLYVVGNASFGRRRFGKMFGRGTREEDLGGGPVVQRFSFPPPAFYGLVNFNL